MILLFIITSVLYLLMVGFVITLYYTYRKDYEELENRLLQLEKRVNEVETNNDMLGEYYERTNVIENIQEQILNYIDIQIKKKYNEKEGEDNMACKKGRGGRKK